MSWTKKVKHPSKVLEVGQEVECQVLEVDAKSKRISLGLKQLEPDPWTIFTEKYSPGAKISGQVRSITDYGVFIGIEEGVDGMVHKSDISWTAKVNNPADLYKKGDHVDAIILSINHDEKKVSLGVKQLYDDPWPTIFNELPPRQRSCKCEGPQHRRLRRLRLRARRRRRAHPAERGRPRRRRRGQRRKQLARPRSATRSRPRSPTSTRRSVASRSRCARAQRRRGNSAEGGQARTSGGCDQGRRRSRRRPGGGGRHDRGAHQAEVRREARAGEEGRERAVA